MMVKKNQPTRFTVVANSAKVIQGLGYTNVVGVTVKAERDDGQTQTLKLLVDRVSGRSWNRHLKVELQLDYDGKRNSPIRRITDVTGLREAALKSAQELWATFTPTPEQLTNLQSGTYDRLITLTRNKYGEGRKVEVKVQRLPFAGYYLSGEFIALLLGDVLDPELDILADDLRHGRAGFHDADNDDQGWASQKHVSTLDNIVIFDYLKPALLRQVKKFSPTLVKQTIESLVKAVKEAEESIVSAKSQVVSSTKALAERKKALENFEEKAARYSATKGI